MPTPTQLLRSSACAIAIAGLILPPNVAAAAAFMRSKKRSAVTPEDAAHKRAPVEEKAAALLREGDALEAAREYEAAHDETEGDPVLLLGAAEAYYQAAKDTQDPDLAGLAKDRSVVALDILYFNLDGGADPDYLLVEKGEVPRLIVRAQELADRSDALEQDLRDAQAAAAQEAESQKKKKGKIDTNKALLISGAVGAGVGGAFLIMGFAGLGAGRHQQRLAEHPTIYGTEYDAVEAKGKRANGVAAAGLTLGFLFAGAGTALILISLKRQGKLGEKSENVAFTPGFGRTGGSLTFSTRF